MIVVLDVDYRPHTVQTACVAFNEWTDASACHEQVILTQGAAADYEPGAFYKRELPYLLGILQPILPRVTVAVIDGYVWLGADRRGLGAHLHESISLPVVGVAKTFFVGSSPIEVRRGKTATSPLYVTAAGFDPALAAVHVGSMHGDARIPALLARVDRLARG